MPPMPAKPLLQAFYASLAIHGILFTALGAGIRGPQETTIEITYDKGASVSVPKEQAPPPAPVKAALPKAQKAVLREPKGVSVSPRRAQQNNPKKIKKQSKGAVRSSGDLMLDPKKGKVFSEYFNLVREAIRRSVAEKKREGAASEGATVTVFFILQSDGSVVNAATLQSEPFDDRDARKYAVQCIREAAPFPAFPRALGIEKISFTVTVLFER